MHEHSYKFNHLHKENTSFSNFTSISLPNNCLVFRRQEEENENGSRKMNFLPIVLHLVYYR